MKYRITNRDTSTVVALDGRFTYSDHDLFRTALDEIQSQAKASCVFDLSELDFIDSTGMGLLVLAADLARSRGFALSVTGAKGTVRRAFEIAELGRIIPMDGEPRK